MQTSIFQFSSPLDQICTHYPIFPLHFTSLYSILFQPTNASLPFYFYKVLVMYDVFVGAHGVSMYTTVSVYFAITASSSSSMFASAPLRRHFSLQISEHSERKIWSQTQWTQWWRTFLPIFLVVSLFSSLIVVIVIVTFLIIFIVKFFSFLSFLLLCYRWEERRLYTFNVLMQCGAYGSDLFQKELFQCDSIAKQTSTHQTFKNIQTQARSKRS